MPSKCAGRVELLGPFYSCLNLCDPAFLERLQLRLHCCGSESVNGTDSEICLFRGSQPLRWLASGEDEENERGDENYEG